MAAPRPVRVVLRFGLQDEDLGPLLGEDAALGGANEGRHVAAGHVVRRAAAALWVGDPHVVPDIDGRAACAQGVREMREYPVALPVARGLPAVLAHADLGHHGRLAEPQELAQRAAVVQRGPHALGREIAVKPVAADIEPGELVYVMHFEQRPGPSTHGPDAADDEHVVRGRLPHHPGQLLVPLDDERLVKEHVIVHHGRCGVFGLARQRDVLECGMFCAPGLVQRRNGTVVIFEGPTKARQQHRVLLVALLLAHRQRLVLAAPRKHVGAVFEMGRDLADPSQVRFPEVIHEDDVPLILERHALGPGPGVEPDLGVEPMVADHVEHPFPLGVGGLRIAPFARCERAPFHPEHHVGEAHGRDLGQVGAQHVQVELDGFADQPIIAPLVVVDAVPEEDPVGVPEVLRFRVEGDKRIERPSRPRARAQRKHHQENTEHSGRHGCRCVARRPPQGPAHRSTHPAVLRALDPEPIVAHHAPGGTPPVRPNFVATRCVTMTENRRGGSPARRPSLSRPHHALSARRAGSCRRRRTRGTLGSLAGTQLAAL